MKKSFKNIAFAIAITLLLTACGKKDEKLIRTAQIEMREYDVASKIPGRIEWIKADEGDSVSFGDELFKLTDREVKAKLGQAMGAVSSAEAQLQLALNGARPEQIEMAERNYNAAKTQFELAEKTLNRMKKLYEEKLISSQEFDVITQKYKGAGEMMDAAKAQYDMAKNGSRKEEKAMAKGSLERAKQSAEEVKAYIDETIVKAPISGIVSKRYSDANELAAVGYPVLCIIDPNEAWAELSLPSFELEKIKIGDVIDGVIRGLNKTEKFKVHSYSAMADYANWRAQDQRGSYEARTFIVKLKPLNFIQGLRPGMTVEFDLNQNKK